ncbi:MAG: CYTH domain-containing protein [Candidatus Poseidoniales archaeon]|nr:MAG: CYTH domain-containing protein [Candidatus Poseidoniales archaeon]
MGIEIERRFLVDGRSEKPWRKAESIDILQYYLSDIIHDDGKILWNGHILAIEEREIVNITTWRIRYSTDKSDVKITLTAKGRRVGATAAEYEWDVSPEVFSRLELRGLPTIAKTRYLCHGDDGLLWEVDEFEGALSGLIIAEVELNSESQEIVLPSWAGLELTNLRGWSNSSLSTMIKDVE